MKTINDVQNFLENFLQKEYELEIDCYNSETNRETHTDKVYDFFDECVLFSAEHSFSGLLVWSNDKSKEEIENRINNVLRKRKLFIIEEYKNAKLETAIKNEGFSDRLFVGYVSDISEIANNYYFQRFFISESNDNLKVIAVEQATMHNEWKETREFQSIESLGEFIQAIKIKAPIDQENLAHYNSL